MYKCAGVRMCIRVLVCRYHRRYHCNLIAIRITVWACTTRKVTLPQAPDMLRTTVWHSSCRPSPRGWLAGRSVIIVSTVALVTTLATLMHHAIGFSVEEGAGTGIGMRNGLGYSSITCSSGPLSGRAGGWLLGLGRATPVAIIILAMIIIIKINDWLAGARHMTHMQKTEPQTTTRASLERYVCIYIYIMIIYIYIYI